MRYSCIVSPGLPSRLNSKTMRLNDKQIQIIRQLALQVAGSKSRVRVFGSRLDDTAHGGDLDLMLDLTEPVDNPCAHGCAIVRTGIACNEWP